MSGPFRLAIATLVLLGGCAGAPRSDPIPAPRVEAMPSPVRTRGATAASAREVDAVVLLDEGFIRFRNPLRPSAGFRFTSRYHVQVMSRAAIERYGRFASRISPWGRILSVSARSYRPGQPNSVRELAPEDVVLEVPELRNILMYRDHALLRANVPGVSLGDIVEKEVVQENDEIFSLTNWWFDNSDPVALSRLVVDVPSGWQLAHTFWNEGQPADFEPLRTPVEGGTRVEFRMENIPPVEPVPQGPARRGRMVQIALVKGPSPSGQDVLGSWDALGSWYRSLVGDAYRLTEEDWLRVEKEVSGRGRGLGPVELFHFVKSQVRYVALYEDRLGGYQPHPAEEVLRNRYGDCKDKATLLVALLRRIGIQAYPMLVGTRHRVLFDEGFPTATAFNHAVVAVPQSVGAESGTPGSGSSYIFLDATDPGGVFGLMPPHLEGQGGLVVKPDGVEVLRIPRSTPEGHRTSMEYEVEDSSRVRFRARLTGAAAAGWVWLSEHAPLQFRARIERSFFGFASVSAFKELTVTRDSTGAVVLKALVKLDYLGPVGHGLLVVPLRSFLFERLLWDPVDDRTATVGFDRVGLWEVSVRFKGLGKALSLPPEVRVENEVGRHVLQIRGSGDSWEIRSEVRLARDRVDPELIPSLRQLDRAIETTSRSAIVFRAREAK